MSDPVPEHTGKFFGTVERRLMNILVEEKVFQKTKVYDYQAVCYGDRHTEYESIMLRSSALKAWLWNPFKYLVTVMMTFLTTVYAMPSYMANCEYFRRDFPGFVDGIQKIRYYLLAVLKL